MPNPANNLKVRRFLRPAVILLLWLGVMGFFFQKEILPSFSGASSSIPLLRAGLPELVGDEWMGIFFQGEQVGYSHTILYPHREEGFYGSALDSTVWLEFSFLERMNRINLHSFCLIAPGGEIAELKISLRSATPPLTVKSHLANGQLEVLIKTGETEKKLSFPLPHPSLPIYALTPFLALRDLKQGESFSLPALDPLASLSAKRPESGTIRFEVAGESSEGYHLLAFYGGMTGDIYLDPTGNVLEITTPFGWVLKRQDAEEVMLYLEGGSKEVKSAF
ncbi:MAG: hypothetical protein U9N73_08300 [Candidatus Auribacterota bacterium]|nr:hypothetical protein [Candidatus Auribacterota bacterium]